MVALVLLYWYLMEVNEETLTFMEGMGVLTKATTRLQLTRSQQFAPIETITQAFIKERLTATDVETSLAFKRKNHPDLLAFSWILPPLSTLREILHDLQTKTRH